MRQKCNLLRCFDLSFAVCLLGFRSIDNGFDNSVRFPGCRKCMIDRFAVNRVRCVVFLAFFGMRIAHDYRDELY